MKLVSVTVENFRSITAARSIPISNLTTLVGPNNEGKSNILRALVIAMTVLAGRRSIYRPSQFRRSRRLYPAGRYDWLNDYPLNLHKKNPDGGSNITLEFFLTEQEKSDFKEEIGSNLNNTLPISFILNKNDIKITIPKQGRGQKTLNQKSAKIADFVSKRIDIQYIPAVRTAEHAQRVVNSLVQGELEKLENNTIYKQALLDIASAQRPILESLSEELTNTMKEFLPNIKKVSVKIEEDDRNYALTEISEMLVDDGAATPLNAKGDGVQSLAALALMRHTTRNSDANKDVVIALEEPESHLHPEAIRHLRKVLNELSSKYQVVITTHNPIFTNRSEIHQNIIVNKNRAYRASNVKEIRDTLGVRLDDNLSSAESVLIVEGEEDRIALRSILSEMDESLKDRIQSGQLAIDILGGASNLRHRIRLHLDAVCSVHVFLDDDDAGKKALKAALDEKIIEVSNINLTVVGGKAEAELEDLYDESVYADIIRSETGLVWSSRGSDKNKKWAVRVKNLLRRAGKPIDDGTVEAIKIKVAQSAAKRGLSSIHRSKIGPIESLKNSLVADIIR